MVSLDPDYISRLFKIYTGKRIGYCINRLRVEEASRLIAEGNKSVIEISMTVGFESLRTFNRAFVKIN
jgi:transcriptional regulator GlxA family with amidase domain